MGQNYPSFQPSYSHEDLVEHFLLTPAELELVLKCRGDAKSERDNIDPDEEKQLAALVREGDLVEVETT